VLGSDSARKALFRRLCGQDYSEQVQRGLEQSQDST